MKKIKKIEPPKYNNVEDLILNLADSIRNSDWKRAVQLLKKANLGDIRAKKEYDEMMNNGLNKIGNFRKK